MKVPFSQPDISEKEIEYVSETLRSGWITTGPRTKEFEKKIAEYVGVKKAVCLNSQTACQEMALRLLGIKEGDEVITTAYTYTATASVIAHVGAKIVLVDTNEDDFFINYNLIADKITERTKAIIVVDLAGIPCDYEKIYKIVEEKKCLFKPETELQRLLGRVAVLSDSAHSFGAERSGRKAGSFADFSAFSFHAVKNLTTAEGGALTWRNDLGFDDEKIYKQLQLLSLHGQSKDAFSKEKLGGWEYDVAGTYFKCNMTDIMVSIGLAQLERYDGMLKRRKEIIGKYDEAFIPLGVKPLSHYTSDYSSSGHLYVCEISSGGIKERNAVIEELAKVEVCANVHYKPLPLLTAYKNLGLNAEDYPNAVKYYEREITLPLHTKLSDEQVDFVIESFVKAIKKICG